MRTKRERHMLPLIGMTACFSSLETFKESGGEKWKVSTGSGVSDIKVSIDKAKVHFRLKGGFT